MFKVIVAITTFNLEMYIAEALDSVLNQETNFDYKIIVADDCSTDSTIDILLEYKKRYPNRIELLFSDKNLRSLANSNRLFDRIDCKYFSFLDGDDYWVGKGRLQKQVDFLDEHPEYSMCAGNTRYLIDGKHGKFLLKTKELNKTYSFADYTAGKMPFFHTSSILVRNTLFNNGLPKCYKEAVGTFEECALRGEDFRRILHLEKAPLYAMSDLLSCYRIHEKGIWQGNSSIRRSIESAIGFQFYAKYFGERHGQFFALKAKKSYQNMMVVMILNHKVMTEYTLKESDSQLLAGFLNDLSKNNVNIYNGNRSSKMKMVLFRIIIKLFYW